MFIPPEIMRKIQQAEEDSKKIKSDLADVKKELAEIKRMLNRCLKK